jgi:ribose transport system substrate-binding protein
VSLHHAVRRRSSLVAVAASLALVVSACGSASSTSSSSKSTSPASATASSSSTAPSTSAAASSSGAANPNTVYAPGVPTLNQLYKGTESTPPTTGPPVAKHKSIVFVSCGQASPGCAGVPDEMGIPAKLLGWSYRIIDGQLNANNGWANGIRQAIALKPDVIVIHGMNCPDVKQPLEDAAKAGIPVMGLEDVDCNDPLLPGGGSAPLFKINMKYTAEDPTGGDYFYRWGAYQADYIIDATKGHAKIIQTVYQPIFGAHQEAGQDAELKKCAGCQIVAKIPFGAADQTPNGPLFQKFTTVLTQQPEANAVMMNFDTDVNTAGLSKAIVDAGRTSMIAVGGEGYAPALQLIREHQGLSAEAAHDGKWMAWGAIDELNRYFNGQPSVPEGVGFRIIDKNHNMMPPNTPYATPVPYKADYEKLWGVS